MTVTVDIFAQDLINIVLLYTKLGILSILSCEVQSIGLWVLTTTPCSQDLGGLENKQMGGQGWKCEAKY